MAIPTGSDGQSWRTFAPAPTVGAGVIERNLPISASVYYEAPLGLFADCLTFDFIGSVFVFGTSSFTLAQSQTPDIQQLSWSLSTTTAPGIFDSIFFVIGDQQLRFSINDGNFHFAFIQGYGDPLEASGSRRGLLITSLSAQPSESVAESPHMSFEPADFESALKLPGDIWFASGVLSVRPGLKMIDSSAPGTLYTGSFLTARATESAAELVTRFGTTDAPSGTFLGLKAVVVDEGLITVNSGGLGPLIRNEVWGGGFFMSDSNSVAVFGVNKEFLIPSGNITSLKGLQTTSGSLNVFSGSILISGDGVRLEISGQSSSMFINGQPVAAVTVSNVPVDKITGAPGLRDGTIYLTPSASTSNLEEAFIRTSGTWVTLVTQSFEDVFDGGTFG